MQGANNDDQIPQIKDRTLYWPTILGIFWFLLALSASSDPGEGQMVPGPFLTAGPVMSAFIAALLCVGWIYQRTWRRLLSTMILPLSVILMVCFVGA
jgi:vacuolar-type H+-ATPase subunit I/STV1